MVSNSQLSAFGRRIGLLCALLAALVALGTIGLVLSEGVGWWYAFRWTLDTLATLTDGQAAGWKFDRVPEKKG